MPYRTFPRKTLNERSSSPDLFGEASSRSEESSSGLKSKSSDGGSAGADFVVAHVDGGARGNPGPAGYGVHIEDARGETIAELSEYLGHKTNNHAEYSGLLAALEWAVKEGRPRIKVVSDSELMVKQLRGEYKVRSPELKELYDRARMLIRKLERFEISHVLRAKNKDADRLANEAMDRGSGRTAAGPPVKSAEVNGIVRN